MPKYLSVLLTAALSSAALLGIAQQSTSPQIKVVPMQKTSPVSGQQMLLRLLRLMPRSDARGNGPVAPALKIHPSDLTILSQGNGGKFPVNRIMSELRFGVNNPAHGTSDMPVWGPLLQSLNESDSNPNMVTQQRVHNLTEYIKSKQR